MQMNDEQIQAVGAALYHVLGTHGASEESLDLALSLAKDRDLTEFSGALKPYPVPADFKDVEAIQSYLRGAAQDLIKRAHTLGVKVEIGLQPTLPLAMGGHVETITMRSIPVPGEDGRAYRAF